MKELELRIVDIFVSDENWVKTRQKYKAGLVIEICLYEVKVRL